MSGVLKEPAPISKVSESMKVAQRQYAKQCNQFKKDNPLCKAEIEGVCKKAVADVHHMKGRNTVELLLDEKYWLPVCRKCHDFLEQNPAVARQMGLSLSRHAKTETV